MAPPLVRAIDSYTGAVADPAEIRAVIRDILLSTWPQRFAPDELRDETPLGESGLGLDSVEMAEVLVACEERGAIRLTDDLFELMPITISRVIEHCAVA